MLVEAYTRDGEQCAWTFDDVEKMCDDYISDETNAERFRAYYKKNLLTIIMMWKYNRDVSGKPCKPFDPDDTDSKKEISQQALLCLLLNLHHGPVWKKCVSAIQENESESQ